MDDEGVRREREAGTGDGERRLVLHRLEDGIAEGLQEQCVDEGVRGLAARPVGEGDPLLLDPGLAAALAIDPLQDLLLEGQGLSPEGVLGKLGVLVRLRLGDGLLGPAGRAPLAIAHMKVGVGDPLAAQARVASLTRSRVNRPKL